MKGERLKIEAHAKINLTLQVLGRRPDGYHELRSVVVPIPLHDDVVLEASDGISVTLRSLGSRESLGALEELERLPQERNLAWRAAQALRQATGCARGARISIVKRIPAGGGLGGGSADAAAVLNGLNELWGLHLSKTRLAEIGATVGSDVPALVWGGPVLMEGRGERVSPLPPGVRVPDLARLVLRFPSVAASTPAVYAEFREEDRGRGANDLQPAACRLYPEIAAALKALEVEGCEGVQMTGSGSTVFGWEKV